VKGYRNPVLASSAQVRTRLVLFVLLPPSLYLAF
jgi:hypothetical protein